MSKKQIKNKVKFWQDKMGLQNWDIAIVFDDFEGEEDARFPAIAKTDAHPSYLLATISFKKSHLRDISEHTVIHELLHIVLSDVHSYMITSPRELLKNGNHAQHNIEKTIAVVERVISRLAKI